MPSARSTSPAVNTNAPFAVIAAIGARVRLDGETLIVERQDAAPATIPLGLIGGLIVMGPVDCTTASLLALSDRELPCAFTTTFGRLRGVLSPPARTGFAARMAQYRLAGASEQAAQDRSAIVASILRSKLQAMVHLMDQHSRSHDDADLSVPTRQVRDLRDRMQPEQSIDHLRGLESAASAAYWQALGAMFRGGLRTTRRTKRPPQDECNAALSFGYGLLVAETSALVAAHGLDPALGLLHPPDAGRPSLALDIVEPYRHSIVDRLVLRATNRNELKASDFDRSDAGVLLNTEGRRTFLGLYQSLMETPAAMLDGTVRTPRSALGAAVADHARTLTHQGADRDTAVGL